MNIVNKITLRQLKENKRRTFVTIIGIIISVAMLTAVATIGVSFLDLLQRQTIAEQGEWHTIYKDVDQDQIEAIEKEENTKEVLLSRDLGYAELASSQNPNKPYLFIKGYNDAAIAKYPLELADGHWPKAENEIVVPETVLPFGLKIGDQLDLEIGERYFTNEEGDEEPTTYDQRYSLNKDVDGEVAEVLENKVPQEYTIVGTMKTPIWELSWSPGYTAVTYVEETTITSENPVHAAVILNKISSLFSPSIFEEGEAFAKKHQIEEVSFNYDLLRFSGVMKAGGMKSALYGVSAVIMIIIMLGSVSLIYNAFAISVAERSRYLGMLGSVGATKQQKRNSVFFEGAVIGIFSIPLGILFGLLGMYITFAIINNYKGGLASALNVAEELNVIVTPGSIIVAIIVSIITIFISTFIPASRASKVSPIDAIKQMTDVKLSGKNVKTSKLVRKIFGIEAEIGLKNLKRNKRRYQATVFSLVISLVLFLSVTYFTNDMKKSLSLTQNDISFDIYIDLLNDEDENFVQQIRELKDVKESTHMSMHYMKALVDEDQVSESLLESSSPEENGKYMYSVVLHVLDDTYLQDYAKRIGISYDTLNQANQAILIGNSKYEDGAAGKYVEEQVIDAKEGDKIALDYEIYHENEFEYAYFADVNIAKLTDELPMGVSNEGYGNLNLIVSEKAFEQFEQKDKLNSSLNRLFLTSSDPVATQQEIEEIDVNEHNIFNWYQIRQSDEQLATILSIFTYGFIALITLISIANILNTISTSIALRKREFGMLRSIGMTPKGFNKMINYESIFYGIKALLYGIPLSIGAMYLVHHALSSSFIYSFTLPWFEMLFAVIAVFLIVLISMTYASAKVKKENIIDALKQENI